MVFTDLGYLLAVEAHGRQGIVQISVVDSVLLRQLHRLLSPLLQILDLCVCQGAVCTRVALSLGFLTCHRYRHIQVQQHV